MRHSAISLETGEIQHPIFTIFSDSEKNEVWICNILGDRGGDGARVHLQLLEEFTRPECKSSHEAVYIYEKCRIPHAR